MVKLENNIYTNGKIKDGGEGFFLMIMNLLITYKVIHIQNMVFQNFFDLIMDH